MRKCIICIQELPETSFSSEHVFPESVGGTLVVQNVCRDCNSMLGSKVDSHLVNHYFISLVRLALGIRGKSGKIPNPFGTGTLKEDPTQKIQVRLHGDGKSLELYVVPNQKIEKLEDGSEQLHWVVDKKDRNKVASMADKTLSRRGLPPVNLEELEKNMHENKELFPWIRLDFTIDVSHYKRSMMKIAYELAHYWLGVDYFTDPTGIMIRDCILDENTRTKSGDKYTIKGVIRPVAGDPLFPFWGTEPYSNIGVLTKQGPNLACYVNVLGVFEGMITMSEDASRYPEFEGRFILIDPLTGMRRESSFIDEMIKITNAADEFNG